VEGNVLNAMLLIKNSRFIDNNFPCIAIPSSSDSVLEWKAPSHCVWGDDEFSQNELRLESKTSVRRIVEEHMPSAKAFFTDILRLPNAGISELLDDLVLMQKENRDDPKRVYRLYERIDSSRRHWPDMIKYAPTPKERQLTDR
jgi:hypothetical protein